MKRRHKSGERSTGCAVQRMHGEPNLLSYSGLKKFGLNLPLTGVVVVLILLMFEMNPFGHPVRPP